MRRYASPVRVMKRSWIQVAAVQPSVDVVTAMLPANVDAPRPSVSAYGTNVSAPKNANVSNPRDSTTAGSPAAARSVPGGVSRRSGPRPMRIPPTTAGPIAHAVERLATTSAVPIATRAASTIRRRFHGTLISAPAASTPAGGRIRIIPGMITEPATATSGSRPRNTARQLIHAETRSASAGPMMPGTTHAVDSTANIRGRTSSG